MYEILESVINSPIILYTILVYTVILKGIALWKSARHSQKYFFIALLVLNSLGFFELLYLLLFQKDSEFYKKITKSMSRKK